MDTSADTTSDMRTDPAPAPGARPLRVAETHTARLLFVEDRVLKWKRPVDLGFVDFTELDRRVVACADEVELNRRLAPDVYLGTASLRGHDGELLEPVVVMRRLPDDLKLSTLVRSGRDATSHVERLARLLAGFHERCAQVPDPARVAGPDALRRLWADGLELLAGAPPDVLDGEVVTEVAGLATAYLDGREVLLQERIDAGRVRDGHGDLVADDVFCLPDGPRVLDCLDFDPDLRCGDVLGDLAFLAMDLELLGASDLALLLRRRYREHSGETHPTSLEHLYVAYRALVRSKVSLVRAGQLVDRSARRPLVVAARRALALSRQHLGQGEVRLVLVGGLPGTGKSTVAGLVSERMGAALHSSDALRAERAAPGQRSYDVTAVAQVYATMLERARLGLERGVSAVLDATWLDQRQRSAAARMAAATSTRLVEVQLTAPPAVALQRLAARSPDHDSDADARVYEALRRRADAWPEAVRVSTEGDLVRVVEQVLEHVDRTVGPGVPLQPTAGGVPLLSRR